MGFVDKMKRRKYNKVAPKIIESLNKTELKYHLAFGSFLFAYRDGNFADDDLDIAMYEKDFLEQDVEAILKPLGFKLSEQWGLKGQVLEQCYKHKKLRIKMDVFVTPPKNHLSHVFDEKRDRYGAYKHFMYTVKKYEVAGIKFKAPVEAEDYFKWSYGNWKERDPKYHWFTGSPSNPRTIVNNAGVEYKKFKK